MNTPNNSADVNTAQAAHTPMPWITGRGGDGTLRIYGRGKGKAENVVCQFGDGIDDTQVQHKHAEANAEFIVRAVNAHTELKEALIALRTWCLANRIQPKTNDAWGKSAFMRAEQAIAKAEVQS